MGLACSARFFWLFQVDHGTKRKIADGAAQPTVRGGWGITYSRFLLMSIVMRRQYMLMLPSDACMLLLPTVNRDTTRQVEPARGGEEGEPAAEGRPGER